MPDPEALSMVLEVHIKDVVAGTTQTLRFTKSPVRLGRNQLNDIALDDPFVSEWHGTIRFDEQGVAYFDLGSTNGSVIDGKRLAKNVAATMSDLSRLHLGRRELMVSRADSPQPAAPRVTDSGVYKTIGWGEQIPALSPPGVPRAPAVAESAPKDQPRATRVGLSEEAEAFVRSLRQQENPGGRLPPQPVFPAASPLSAASEPRPSAGSGVLEGAAAKAGPVRSFGSEPPVVLSASMVASTSNGSEETEATLSRQRNLLEAFAEAFVGLRKGYEQFGAEVGVRTVNGTTPLHRVRSSREAMAYALNPSVDPAVVASDLIAIFADFGIHHIAMMEGITEGVRALLQSLDPRANDFDAGARLFSSSKTKSQWKTYLDHFDQLITDDEQLHVAIFGEEFARAYASVTLGDGSKGSKQGGG